MSATDSETRGERILGVDPGLRVTGYAILEVGPAGPLLCEAGVIRSTERRRKSDMGHRLASLYTSIDEVIESFQPSAVAVEQLYAHYDHPRTAILMAHARGAILFAAAERNAQVVHYTARQIKRLLTGSGKASKDQVQHAIRNELRLAVLLEPNDVADAAAVGLCHYYVSRNAIAVS